ncbi:adenylate/guanylate cyclase domain-containing protein [Gammaproteobacteria bacterium]|nr:adenylate/guanylate cyclase domain-containing protein [Gammaproteobacteria bacterium]
MEDRLPRKLAAILYADVAGYSQLTGEDEDTTHRTLSAYLDLVASTIDTHRGQVMHYAGDAVLAKFDAVIDAMSAAVSIQNEIKTHNEAVPDERNVQFRIGVNSGDVIEDRGDIYGDGVNVAARLESLAEPGGICISDAVRSAVGKRLHVAYEDMGEQKVKNITDPVRAYRVLLDISESSTNILKIPPPSGSNKPSIAVLPFTNMSGDPEQEYFSDGITEDIITDLSKVAGLFVVARNSTFIYKGEAVNVQQVSKELDVCYVLEGSVRKSGNRTRITSQLVDGSTGGHLWAERYDRDLTDIFAVQDEIALSITGALKVALAPEEERAIGKVPTADIDAYDFYLRGRQFLHRLTHKNLKFAIQMFSRAIDLDPSYARAHAGMADCHSFIYMYYEGGDDVLEHVIGDSTRALELDPELAEAHASRGLALSLHYRYEEAAQEFQAAIDKDPMLYEAYYYFGRAYWVQGKLEMATKLLERAASVGSEDLQSLGLLTTAYRSIGSEEDVRRTAERTLKSAKRQFDQNPDNARAAYGAALVLVDLGRREEALEWAERALAIDADDSTTQYNIACIYARLDDLDKAMESLELSFVTGFTHREWLENDPDFYPLRNEPRFQALLKEPE